MSALRMVGIGLDYPDRPGVLQDVSLEIGTAELVVVTGRSGSGKSSLIAVAAGLQAPTRGKTAVGRETMPSTPHEAAKVRAKHLGLVFQHLHLLPELSVVENVELPLRFRGTPRGEAVARANEMLEVFGIAHLARRLPEKLSGGEQQRVAIARAMVLRPTLLLADEPTSALDMENAQTVVQALQQATREGTAVLVASHDSVFDGIGRRMHMDAGVLRSE